MQLPRLHWTGFSGTHSGLQLLGGNRRLCIHLAPAANINLSGETPQPTLFILPKGLLLPVLSFLMAREMAPEMQQSDISTRGRLPRDLVLGLVRSGTHMLLQVLVRPDRGLRSRIHMLLPLLVRPDRGLRGTQMYMPMEDSMSLCQGLRCM